MAGTGSYMHGPGRRLRPRPATQDQIPNSNEASRGVAPGLKLAAASSSADGLVGSSTTWHLHFELNRTPPRSFAKSLGSARRTQL